MQLPLFVPETDWKPPAIADLPDWGSAKRVCLDTETFDPYLKTLGPSVRRGGYIAGFCVGIDGGPSVYAPVRHKDGGNLELEPVLRWMKDCARRFSGELVGMHLQYDLDYLWEEGVETPNVRRYRDVMVADPLIDELRTSYSLKAISARWGVKGKDTTVLNEALAAFGYKDGSGIHALHSKYVGAYGEGDVKAPLEILRLQEAEIKKQSLDAVWELESRVLPVLVKMRRRGVRVNLQKLEKIENWARAEQARAIAQANGHLTMKLAPEDITRTEAVGRALAHDGVGVNKTKTGRYSIDKHFLKSLDHPAAVHLRRAKQMSTLQSTFCESIRKHAIIAADGSARIHATFNQLRKTDDDGSEGGAAFGRLSSEDPNLQNQPARDEEIGPMWRDIYEPELGALWASKDYSQQEPRVAVHLAAQCKPEHITPEALTAALDAQRQYRENPKTDFHDMMTRMIYGDLPKAEHKIKRKFCKEIYLGLSYGMGGFKLCRQLGLPTKIIEGKNGAYVEVAGDEGQRLMDEFDARVPFVRKTAKFAQQLAEQRGFITTIGGRRCRFPALTDYIRSQSKYKRWEKYDWTHKAFNRAVQGGSADQTKHAVVALDEAGAFVQLQVHDELDSSVDSVCTGRKYAGIMVECFPLSVPSKVDLEVGHSWGTAIDADEWERRHAA